MEPPRGIEPRTYALRAPWPSGFPHRSCSTTSHFPHRVPRQFTQRRVISGLLAKVFDQRLELLRAPSSSTSRHACKTAPLASAAVMFSRVW